LNAGKANPEDFERYIYGPSFNMKGKDEVDEMEADIKDIKKDIMDFSKALK
jgi:hypothetical protein